MLIYIVGAVFMVGGIFLFLSNLRRTRTGLRAPAQVVDREWVRRRTSEGTERASYPVVLFRTDDGQEVRTRTLTGGLFTRVRIGKNVRVIYEPGNPRNVVIDSVIGRGTAGSALFVLAGIFLLAEHAFGLIR